MDALLPALPTELGKYDQARSIFERHAEAILAGWLARKEAPPTRRAESPNAWFKREAYRLLVLLIKSGRTRVFRDLAERDRRSNKLVDEATKNPFKLGLLAMIADDHSLSRSNRHVFGNQMLYAWVHNVPPDFLNAFLAISGGPAQVALKLKTKQAEPGFQHRYIAARLCE